MKVKKQKNSKHTWAVWPLDGGVGVEALPAPEQGEGAFDESCPIPTWTRRGEHRASGKHSSGHAFTLKTFPVAWTEKVLSKFFSSETVEKQNAFCSITKAFLFCL
jgi:hypothetical protein